MTRDELAEELRIIVNNFDIEPEVRLLTVMRLLHDVDAYVAAERERLALAIEALPVWSERNGYAAGPVYRLGHQRAQNHAARIVREGGAQ